MLLVVDSLVSREKSSSSSSSLFSRFPASEGIQGGGIGNARKRVAYPFWNVGFRRGFRCGYTVMSRVERNRLIFYIGIMYRQSGYIRLERTIGNADTIEFAIANEASLTVTSMTRSIFLGSLR